MKLNYGSAIDQERLLKKPNFLYCLSKMYIFIIAIVGATVKDNFTAPSGFCLWRDNHRIFVLNFDKFWPFIAKIIQTSDDTTQRFDFLLLLMISLFWFINAWIISYSNCSNWHRISNLLLNFGCLFTFCYSAGQIKLKLNYRLVTYKLASP